MNLRIGSVHGRIRAISGWISDEVHRASGDYYVYPNGPSEIGRYIVNLHPRNICAEYKLIPKYRKYLRKAIKQHKGR